MFTLVDIIHLIQYYYLTATGYDNAALEVEQVDLSALRGEHDFGSLLFQLDLQGHSFDKQMLTEQRYSCMFTDIEVHIDVPPPPIISVHPDDQLYTACAALVRTHARRLPLIDRDEQTGKETIVSVLTQYRVLKFLAINVRFVLPPPLCESSPQPYLTVFYTCICRSRDSAEKNVRN